MPLVLTGNKAGMTEIYARHKQYCEQAVARLEAFKNDAPTALAQQKYTVAQVTAAVFVPTDEDKKAVEGEVRVERRSALDAVRRKSCITKACILRSSVLTA